MYLCISDHDIVTQPPIKPLIIRDHQRWYVAFVELTKEWCSDFNPSNARRFLFAFFFVRLLCFASWRDVNWSTLAYTQDQFNNHKHIGQAPYFNQSHNDPKAEILLKFVPIKSWLVYQTDSLNHVFSAFVIKNIEQIVPFCSFFNHLWLSNPRLPNRHRHLTQHQHQQSARPVCHLGAELTFVAQHLSTPQDVRASCHWKVLFWGLVYITMDWKYRHIYHGLYYSICFVSCSLLYRTPYLMMFKEKPLVNIHDYFYRVARLDAWNKAQNCRLQLQP